MGCQTYSYLLSCKASLPISWYQIILLGDRGTCVNILPRVALDSGEARIRTRDLLIAGPASSVLTIRPPSHNLAVDFSKLHIVTCNNGMLYGMLLPACLSVNRITGSQKLWDFGEFFKAK